VSEIESTEELDPDPQILVEPFAFDAL